MKNNAPRSRTQRNEPQKEAKPVLKDGKKSHTLDGWTVTKTSILGGSSAKRFHKRHHAKII